MNEMITQEPLVKIEKCLWILLIENVIIMESVSKKSAVLRDFTNGWYGYPGIR